MKTIQMTFVLIIIAAVTMSSCSKTNNPKPKTTVSISTIAYTWANSEWGGVAGNSITFSISASTAIGTVTSVGSQPFGFAVGDQLLTGITANSNGTYSATGMYTFGAGNTSSSTRPATLTLSDNNTQLTIFYPAINSSFPNITYVFTKSIDTISL